MKKLITFLITAAILCVGATYFTAQQFQQEVLVLEAKVKTNGNMELLTSEMTSSWLGAKGQHVVAMTIESQGPQLIFTLPWQASYFPGWVNLAANLTIESDNGRQRENLVQAVGLTDIPLTGRADFRKISLGYQLGAFENKADVHFAVKDLNFKTTFYYSGEQRNSLAFKQLSFRDRKVAFDFHDVQIQGMQQGDFPWMTSSWHYQVDKMQVQDFQNNPALLFEQGQFKLDYELKPERFYWHNQVSFAGLSAKQMGIPLLAVEAGNLSGSLVSKEGQYIGDILLELSDINNVTERAALDPNKLLEKMNQLVIQGEPRFELEDLSFKVTEPIDLNPKVQGWAEFDTHSQFSMTKAVKSVRAELNLNNLPAELFIMLGVPLDFVSDDGRYQIKIDNGLLYFNGEPFMPL